MGCHGCASARWSLCLWGLGKVAELCSTKGVSFSGSPSPHKVCTVVALVSCTMFPELWGLQPRWEAVLGGCVRWSLFSSCYSGLWLSASEGDSGCCTEAVEAADSWGVTTSSKGICLMMIVVSRSCPVIPTSLPLPCGSLLKMTAWPVPDHIVSW